MNHLQINQNQVFKNKQKIFNNFIMIQEFNWLLERQLRKFNNKQKEQKVNLN